MSPMFFLVFWGFFGRSLGLECYNCDTDASSGVPSCDDELGKLSNMDFHGERPAELCFTLEATLSVDIPPKGKEKGAKKGDREIQSGGGHPRTEGVEPKWGCHPFETDTAKGTTCVCKTDKCNAPHLSRKHVTGEEPRQGFPDCKDGPGVLKDYDTRQELEGLEVKAIMCFKAEKEYIQDFPSIGIKKWVKMKSLQNKK